MKLRIWNAKNNIGLSDNTMECIFLEELYSEIVDPARLWTGIFLISGGRPGLTPLGWGYPLGRGGSGHQKKRGPKTFLAKKGSKIPGLLLDPPTPTHNNTHCHPQNKGSKKYKALPTFARNGLKKKPRSITYGAIGLTGSTSSTHYKLRRGGNGSLEISRGCRKLAEEWEVDERQQNWI